MTNAVKKRRAPIPDGRLSAAMALAENCRIFADIGADHGKLSAALLLQDSSRRALIADISAPALSKAEALIARMQLNSRTTFAVADGLEALDQLQGEAVDTVFILGMGGDTVSGILQRGASRLHGAAVILGAQTDLPQVRKNLCRIGYRIQRETVVSEAGREYLLIRAEKGDTPEYTEEEILLGPVLLQELPASWLPLLQRRERLLEQGIRAMRRTMLAKDEQRLAQFEREIGYVQRAMALLERKNVLESTAVSGLDRADRSL